MKPGSVRWTLAEEDQVRELVAAGTTASEAAKRLKRGMEAVRGKVANMGLKFAPGHRGRTSEAHAREAADFIRPAPARYASRTAMIFGDPPIGRSALDQRGGK